MLLLWVLMLMCGNEYLRLRSVQQEGGDTRCGEEGVLIDFDEGLVLLIVFVVGGVLYGVVGRSVFIIIVGDEGG